MKYRALALGAALAMAAGVATAAPATAAPRPPAAADAQLTCSHWGTWNPTYSCYDRRYDNFWVYDGDADGNSAMVRWSTQAGESGACTNSNGSGTWKRCSYDLREYRNNGSRNHVTWDEYRQNLSEGTDAQLLTAPAGTSAT